MEAQKLLEDDLAGVYGPETLRVIQKGFDAAWQHLAPGYADSRARAEGRLHLARIMIMLARENMTDWEWLQRRALQLMPV
jgi:hypothetical protein